MNATQSAYELDGREVGKVPNLIGIVAGDETGLAYAIDMTYAGKDLQVGEIAIRLHVSQQNIIDLCKELNLPFIIYPACSKCFKPIYGSYSFDENMKDCHIDCLEKKP
jgi:hypothetical protein